MASTERSKNKHKPMRPSTTIAGREGQLVSLAVNLAERQLHDGTASAQVISHYLKLGSTREQLEQARLSQENELLMAKIKQIGSQERVEEMYKEALDAMKSYSGQDVDEIDEY